MRRYEITLTTTAKVVVTVDASDADEACDMAIDYVDSDEVLFENEWDIESVEEVDPRD
jgi:hypothetical protein